MIEELKQQIDLLFTDLKAAYNSSGKKVSGAWESGLEAKYVASEAMTTVFIEGYNYLEGRGRGKMPPVEDIKRWIQQKGITPLRDNMTISSLAFAIAKKIAEQGTDTSRHLDIYDKVITPQRIDNIIKAVGVVNVNNFIQQIQQKLQEL